MKLTPRAAKLEKQAEARLARHPLTRIIPVNERAPLTLGEWSRLAELYDLALSLLKERLKAGARLLTGHPSLVEEEEALLLSGAECFADDCEAFDLLEGAERVEVHRLMVLKWWNTHRVRLLEEYLAGPGSAMPDEMKAEMRLAGRA